MTFYSDMADTAEELIAEFGQSVTLKVASNGAYDPETGSTAVTYADQSAKGVVIDYDKKLIDGTKVRIGDRQCLLSPLGITEPKDGDKIAFGAEVWQVVPPVTVTNPAGVPVLYEVQIRK